MKETFYMKKTNNWRLTAALYLGAAGLVSALEAAPKNPGSLLPSDTVAVLTIPHFPDAKAAFLKDPFVQLFDDPSMKDYTGGVMKSFEDNVVGGLEQQFGIKLSEYMDLINGQLTLGLFVNPAGGRGLPEWDLFLALDAGDRGEQLKAKIGDLKRRVDAAGQALKPLTIRNQSFFHFKPGGESGKAKRGGGQSNPDELYLGQVDSFLVISTSASVIERSLAASTGSGANSLANEPSFKRIFSNQLKDSYGYGWVNFSHVYQMIEAQVKRMDGQFAGNANALIPKPTAVLKALGLDGLQGLAFNLKDVAKGSMVEFSMAIPERDRRGVFSLIAMEKKESLPLPWIADDVISFSRTRVNLAKVWMELKGMVGELSPPVMGLVELYLGGLGKDRDATFDFQESFFENLGDDVIMVGLPPRSEKLEDIANPPSLTLLGSPDSKRLADAVVVATGLIPSGGNVLSEREFLGQKIYSFKIPGLAIPGMGAQGQDAAAGAGFYLAPVKGYLAFSMDEKTIEDYLRGPSASQKSLRRVAGLAEASAALGRGPLTSFRYDNAAELVNNIWELGRENPDLIAGSLAGAAMVAPQPIGGLEPLTDFSSLPPFERVAKYFHYSVGGSSSDSQYLNYRWFRPTPPALK